MRPALCHIFVTRSLRIENRDDFQRPGIHDDNLVVDEEEFISAPIG